MNEIQRHLYIEKKCKTCNHFASSPLSLFSFCTKKMRFSRDELIPQPQFLIICKKEGYYEQR